MHIFKVGEKPECLRKPTHTQGEDAKCPAPLRIGTHDFHAVLHTHLRFLHYKSILLQPCFITLTLTHPLNLNGKPCDSCGPTLQVQLLENTLENCVLANRSSANVGMQTCWTKLVYFCHYCCHHRGLYSLLLYSSYCSPCLCLVSENVFALLSPVSKYARNNHNVFIWIFCVRSSVCVCSMDRRKLIERGKKERRRLHSLFQNRRERGKEKQATGEVRRVPVRKDEKGGGGGWGI